MQLARLLFPALRWDPATGFEHEQPTIERALARGVGGFVLFGGEIAAVRTLTTELRAASATPLLIGADLERGAGQQFKGATALPPLAAIGSLDDLGDTRQAAALTAREALALGVNWVFAPVADLDIEPLNPIVGTRSFGPDPVRVAAQVTAWIEGCRDEGALCCTKHFPGHGRTVEDSHETLPVVRSSIAEMDVDLTPFRAAVIAGTDAIMTAHVAYPALDPSGQPATLSAAIIEKLLRKELGFGGLVVTDALIMKGVLSRGEAQAVVEAVRAGCDALLYPPDWAAAESALERALGQGLSRSRAARALGRLGSAALGAIAQREAGLPRPADAAWALGLAERTVRVERGELNCPREFDLLTIDDDLGGPYPAPSRAPFVEALRRAGFDPRPVEHIDGARAAVIALYADIRAWKGRPGLGQEARRAVAAAASKSPEAPFLLFGHPRLAADLEVRNLITAWGGEAVMQKATARWLAGESTPPSAA